MASHLALASRLRRDGGNIEGLSLKFIDEQPQQAYCANTSLYTLPGTQPIDRLKPVISLQVRAAACVHGQGCTAQAAEHHTLQGAAGRGAVRSHKCHVARSPSLCAPARQDGKFCPTSQPAWSAFREASFGFGLLEVLNATHATWEWKRDAGLGSGQGKFGRRPGRWQ